MSGWLHCRLSKACRGRGWHRRRGPPARAGELPVTGVSVRLLSDPTPIDADDPLLLLNTAFFTGGLEIEVAAGENVTLPVEIVSVNSGERAESFAPRIEVAIGDGAALTLVETHLRH